MVVEGDEITEIYADSRSVEQALLARLKVLITGDNP